jgi:hypothetical protein
LTVALNEEQMKDTKRGNKLNFVFAEKKSKNHVSIENLHEKLFALK